MIVYVFEASLVLLDHLYLAVQHTKDCRGKHKDGWLQVLRTHKDTLLSVLETLVHDPLVEWVPKHSKSSADEQENAMARDAMATIEGASYSAHQAYNTPVSAC